MGLSDQAYRLSPSLWVEDYGLLLDFKSEPVAPDKIQRQILDSTAPQVVLLCHRQWGKSSISGLICLHRALFFEKSLCLLVAPSLRQSSENFRRIKTSMELLGLAPPEDTKLSCQLPNKSRIVALPGGDEGANIRGYSGPAIVVEDEAALCNDLLHEAIRPMLISNPEARLILASTAHGQRGHFYKIWTEGCDWLKAFAPVTENKRFAEERLEKERRLGDLYFRQEFLCEFLADEFSLFDDDRIAAALDDTIEEIRLTEY
jgi:hypothetical protein